MKLQTLALALVLLAPFANAASVNAPAQVVDIAVTENGFEPNSITVSSESNVQLNVTRKTEDTCAKAIQIPDEKVKVALPLNQTVAINLGHLNKGTIKFGCAMKMMEAGVIVVQ